MKNLSLTVIILAHNEENSISSVIMEANDTLSKLILDYEIIFIDDASSDQTYQAVRSINLCHLKIHQNKKNIGIGATLKKGYKLATKDYICAIPGDGQFRIQELIDVIQSDLLSQYHVILFSRFGRPNYSIERKLVSYCQKIFNLLLFKLNIADINWIKVFPRESFNMIDLNMNNLLVETELILKLKILGLKLIERPSYYVKRQSGKSKAWKLENIISAFIGYPRLLKEIIRTKKQRLL